MTCSTIHTRRQYCAFRRSRYRAEEQNCTAHLAALYPRSSVPGTWQKRNQGHANTFGTKDSTAAVLFCFRFHYPLRLISRSKRTRSRTLIAFDFAR
eukprot:1028314-Rhodomonas_salina.2